ncbi:Maf family protein [Pseudobdellovibrio exovorus]|uniref:7-methyl-GTP pyrophosphatase n=1 Tax=Pseudobdellovibrio exovorus JSS TaxID=1184267 RepID=M4VB00_9BACT|nr:nucleoside triphosphate pyrophosphatase [Pseudobdellovibrio exovorus]AGH95201.1 Maf-like protein [Pseudobdellovibrio exovorus JSS]
MNIILASSSIYRQELLGKTGLTFTCHPPHVDEESLTQTLLSQGASPLFVAEGLSKAKAQKVFSQIPSLPMTSSESLIIAGDQLLDFQGKILNKPMTHEVALQQLSLLNGKEHNLITAITLMAAHQVWHLNHVTRLKMKQLSADELQNYLLSDLPYDCAGSYRIEKQGIILFERIDCDDFSAIQGIPMIWLSNRLKEIGYEFFKRQT